MPTKTPRRRDASRLGRLVLLLVACTRDPIDGASDDGPTVDPDIYARGFCSLRCWRLDECGLGDGVPREACEASCVDEALATLPEDPCWAQSIELRRCIVRWSACEEVPEESAPVGAGTTCEMQAADLDACEE